MNEMTTPQIPPSPERHVFEFAKYAMSIGWQDLKPLPLWKAYNSWSQRFGRHFPADSIGKPRLTWEEFNTIYSKILFHDDRKLVSLESQGNLYRSTVE